MANNPEMTPGEEAVAFHYAMGQAVTQWAHIENNLYLIATRCFGDDPKGTLANSFFSIENFRSKLTFVARAFETTSFNKKFETEWLGIRDHVSSLSGSRNAIAHGRSIIYPASGSGRRYALVPRHGKPLRKPPVGKSPPNALCVKNIDLAARQFSRASSRLMSLYWRIGGDKDHSAEFAQQELQHQTLAQLRHQIHAMLPPRDGSLPP